MYKAWNASLQDSDTPGDQWVYRGVVSGENLAEEAEEREPKEDVRELGPLSCAT